MKPHWVFTGAGKWERVYDADEVEREKDPWNFMEQALREAMAPKDRAEDLGKPPREDHTLMAETYAIPKGIFTNSCWVCSKWLADEDVHLVGPCSVPMCVTCRDHSNDLGRRLVV